MPHVYAIVIADPNERGFDKVASDTADLLVGHYEPVFLTNEIPVEQREILDPDFEAHVISGGNALVSRSASGGSDPVEELDHLIDTTSKFLRSVNDRLDRDNSTETAAGALGALERALDAWDEFEQARRLEPEPKYPGICWPTWADNTSAPEGWSWVERDDEADMYKDDEEAAAALILQLGRPDVEIRWFNRYTHEPIPGNKYVTGASVAINIPEPEES